MFVDAMLLVSDAQAVSATGFSTNTIDLGNPTVKNRIGSGEPMAFVVEVDVAADFTTGDETYTFQVVQSANANLSSPDVIAQIAVSAASSGLAAGKRIVIPLPGGYPVKRYIGMQYTLAGTTPSITVTAHLMPLSMVDPTWDVYAKNYTP